jgi:RNA polymerase sigma factor (sigma-70 family)
MTYVSSSFLLRQIRRLSTAADDPRSDRELLERYATDSDSGAFTELVRRHGPMVLGVCRRILREPADAEDAFQAAFLVLARKAAAVRGRDSAAGFLYGVARNVARRARDAAVRRALHEGRAPARTPAEPATELTARALFEALDEELAWLPEKLRTPLVLCYLEGLTRDEAARRTGCPLGTLKDRLERGKKVLRAALARRGVSVPAALEAAAVKSALAGTALPAAAALARAALRPPLTVKLKLASAVLVIAGAAGLGLWSLRPGGGEPPPAAPAEAPQPRADLYGDPLPEGAVARLGSLRLRHAGLSSYCFSADGKTVVSAGSDRRLRTWDVATGRQVREVPLRGTARAGRPFLSPDGKKVVACDGKTIALWDADTGKQLKTLPAPKGDILTPYFSPDGKSLIVLSWEPRVVLVDWQTGAECSIALPARKIGHDSTFHAHLSPDGRWLVAGGGVFEPLCIFDAATGREVHRLLCNAITSAASPDSKTLAVCGREAVKGGERIFLAFHELPGGKETARFPLGPDGCLCLAFSPDGKSLACGFSDRSFVMDCATGREKFVLPDRPISPDFSPDGSTLAADTATRLRFWDAATGKERPDIPGEFGTELAAAVSPDGRLLAAADWLERSVNLWDMATGRLLRRLPLGGEHRYVRDLSFSPDGRTLAAAQYKGFLQSWDVATGREQRTIQLQDPARANPDFTYFFHLYLSPDARRVSTLEQIFGPGGQFTRLALWEAATGKLLRQHALPAEARGCAWSADGTAVALTLNDGLRLVDVDSGAVRFQTAKAASGHPPAFAPDDRLIAAVRRGDKGEVVVWEAATGKEVAAVAAGKAAHFSLAPDGRSLITTDERALRVWDLASGKERRRWLLPLAGTNPWGETFVSQLVLTPDGRRAVTTLADGTALVWDLALEAPAAAAPTAEEVARWWADLAAEDAARGYAAAWRLTAAPQAAVPLLRRHLRPVAEADLAEARRLVADLNADAFAVREKAFQRLEALGDTALPALRQALAKDPPPEVRRRAEELVQKAHGALAAGDRLRVLRALAVLEHAGTPEARRLLEELAAGLPQSRQTEEARAALARLGSPGR